MFFSCVKCSVSHPVPPPPPPNTFVSISKFNYANSAKADLANILICPRLHSLLTSLLENNLLPEQFKLPPLMPLFRMAKKEIWPTGNYFI